MSVCRIGGEIAVDEGEDDRVGRSVSSLANGDSWWAQTKLLNEAALSNDRC